MTKSEIFQCFAHLGGSTEYPTERCLVLTDMICKKRESCPFFKTKETYNSEAEKNPIIKRIDRINKRY